MGVNIRIRNGMTRTGGDGGASEGDLRGQWSDAIDTIGVVDLDGGHLLVHEAGTPAMTVVVDEGVGYIPNTSFDETDSESIKFWEGVVSGTTGSRTLVIGANSSGQTRIDQICLKIDPGASPDPHASDVAELIVVEGTPGAGIPATPSFYLAMANVTVVNGATEIEDADISDVREQSNLKDAFMPDTLTGKRITKRVSALGSGATITSNSDLYDEVIHANTSGAGTQTVSNPTGTPTDGQVLIIRLKCTNAQTYDFGTQFRAGSNLPLPETHDGSSKTDYLGFIRNVADSKWDLLALLQGF